MSIVSCHILQIKKIKKEEKYLRCVDIWWCIILINHFFGQKKIM
uniref:Uncharacterized protein n=1 Tax=Rhizophora mucronata TaxID=61149 RepID=A0A2P2PEW8_RHIMU